eukprot:ctg_4520.g633
MTRLASGHVASVSGMAAAAAAAAAVFSLPPLDAVVTTGDADGEHRAAAVAAAG